MSNWIHILLMVCAATLLFAGSAMAYLDPVSSSFIVNSIAAAFFGALFYIKLRWHRIKALFRGKNAQTANPPKVESVEK